MGSYLMIGWTSLAFDCLRFDIFIDKLAAYGIRGPLLRLIDRIVSKWKDLDFLV